MSINHKRFYSDICIVGSGIAGLSLCNFLNKKITINLIEKGSEKYDPQKQINDSIFNEVNYVRKNKKNTISQLGGTGNAWASRLMKLDKSDFEDINEDNKWPIAFEEISNYYNKALNFFNVCEEQSHFFDEKISKKLIYWPKNKKKFSFKSKFLKKIIKRKNLNLFLENELTSIEYSENFNHTMSITCISKGQINKFYAKKFILCCGAIETVKILLNSEIQQFKNFKFINLGNYYMDHPTIKTNSILIKKKLIQDFLINHKLNYSFQIGFKHSDNSIKANNYSVFNFALSDQLEYLEKQLKLLKHFKLDALDVKILFNPLLFIEYLISFNWPYNYQIINIFLQNYHNYIIRKKNVNIQMSHHLEQKPIFSNSLFLTNVMDKNNLREVKLKNEIHDDSINSSILLNNKINSFFEPHKIKFNLNLDTISDASHHMGTTRMHSNPKKGFVDSNCKVNEINNLYIMGPSIFTTSGHANPVLTLIALSIRLADKINANIH